MRQRVEEVITAIKDADQTVCPGSCRDVVLTTIAKRVWLVSVVVMFLQDSVTHPRHFLFAVRVVDGLVRRAVVQPVEETAEEACGGWLVGWHFGLAGVSGDE